MLPSLDVPVFRLSRFILTDHFDSLYKELKHTGVSITALLTKAAALALQAHPIINAQFDQSSDGGNGAIRYPSSINIGNAVATSEGGLLTPIIQQCETKDVYQVSRDWKELVSKAKGKALTPKDMSGASFYITNLGSYNIDQFDAILPPNVGAIMSVGVSSPSPAVMPNGFMGVVKRMTVTLTCDHRHIYGAHAAEFLKTLAEIIEDPIRLLKE
eukprot:GHVN01072263.1.p1 GENE.GHVN01072263.1~~GHVN01072263.1.p1  ORF type:complete len:214 (+),score=38.68 GHVN01072263.1:152-793(+)